MLAKVWSAARDDDPSLELQILVERKLGLSGRAGEAKLATCKCRTGVTNDRASKPGDSTVFRELADRVHI